MAAPFLLFPSPKRSLAMLVVPGLWLLHWLVVSRQEAVDRRQRAASNEQPRFNSQSTIHNRQSAIPLTPMNGVLLLMALMVLVSLWATFDMAYSLPKISGMVLGLGVFFAVAREGERVQGAESGLHPNEVAGALIWVLSVIMAVSVALIALLFRWKEGGNTSPQSTRRTQRKGVKAQRESGKKAEDGVDRRDKLHGWRLVLVTILCLLATFFVGAVFLLTQSRGGT